MEELASLGFISVIPAILAIVLSFATKNTIVALAIACITGTTLTGLAQGTNLLETLLLGFPTLLKENLGNILHGLRLGPPGPCAHPAALRPDLRRTGGGGLSGPGLCDWLRRELSHSRTGSKKRSCPMGRDASVCRKSPAEAGLFHLYEGK